MPLPPLPVVDILTEEDRTPPAEPGFMRLRRWRLRARYPDGHLSEPFSFDAIERSALDAVVLAAHFCDERGRRCVYVRSALRPAVRLRPPEVRPLPEKDTLGMLWELPAGLVEADECRSATGLRHTAARELAEELGFEVAPERFAPLGPATFPAPGIIAERHHFFHVEVAPAGRTRPREDGSVLEQRALVASRPLDELLELARQGEIEDEKTELGLRRLAELP